MADMLITLSEFAASEQQDVDNATATLAIELATGAVQAAAGQRIVEVADDEATIDLDVHDCSLYLPLPEGPVTEVTSVTVGETVVTDYLAQLGRGRLWRSMGWRSATLPYWNAPSAVTVVYTHGYPTGHQKLQLARGVALDLAKTGYNAAGGSGPVESEQIDDYSVRYARIAASIESALDPDGPLARALRRQYGRPALGSVRLMATRSH